MMKVQSELRTKASEISNNIADIDNTNETATIILKKVNNTPPAEISYPSELVKQLQDFCRSRADSRKLLENLRLELHKSQKGQPLIGQNEVDASSNKFQVEISGINANGGGQAAVGVIDGMNVNKFFWD
jgi:hypothetical protein